MLRRKSSAPDNIDNLSNLKRLSTFTFLAIALYSIYYFGLCKVPFIGTPTFRIDYFATTVNRAWDPLSRSLIHARPISELYVFIQALVARCILHGQSRYIIYPFQHLVPLIYFVCIARTLEIAFKTRLAWWVLLSAWALFMVNPGVVGNVYKLETIVGTLSMLFGGAALLLLSKWDESRKNGHLAAFFIFYALSIFSKEDFILPPIIFLAWFALRDGLSSASIKAYGRPLAGIGAILVFFITFNKFLIPGRSYMDPVALKNSPYFMSLNPLSLLKVFKYYTMGVGLHLRLLAGAYAAISIFALTRNWKQPLLIGAIVGGLMAPYLIMPNHLFAYYGLNWWAWEAIGIVVLLQLSAPSIRVHSPVIVTIGLAAIVPSFYAAAEHHSYNWFQAQYLRTKFQQSRNLQSSLRSLRERINQYQVVGVTGIGPGEIDQTPWQNNGETAFYLSRDLSLSPRWILFVKSTSPSFQVKSTGNPTATVQVKPYSDIGNYSTLPIIKFDSNGVGELTAPESQADQSISSKP